MKDRKYPCLYQDYFFPGGLYTEEAVILPVITDLLGKTGSYLTDPDSSGQRNGFAGLNFSLGEFQF